MGIHRIACDRRHPDHETYILEEIVMERFQGIPAQYEQLVNEAFEAAKNAYAPYSNFPVGACLICEDGRKFWGCNVENASYPNGICGERNAIFSAYAYGYRAKDIKAIAIVCNSPNVGTSCGLCRQVMYECLDHKIPVVFSNGKETMVTNMEELLPWGFGPEDLV